MTLEGARLKWPSVKFGSDVYIADTANIDPFTYIADKVRIGKITDIGSRCLIGEGAEIQDAAMLGIRVVLGQSVVVSTLAMVREHSSVAALTYIGKAAEIGPYCTIGVAARIGRDVGIGKHTEIAREVQLIDGTRIASDVFVPATPPQVMCLEYPVFPYSPSLIGVWNTASNLEEWERGESSRVAFTKKIMKERGIWDMCLEAIRFVAKHNNLRLKGVAQ